MPQRRSPQSIDCAKRIVENTYVGCQSAARIKPLLRKALRICIRIGEDRCVARSSRKDPFEQYGTSESVSCTLTFLSKETWNVRWNLYFAVLPLLSLARKQKKSVF